MKKKYLMTREQYHQNILDVIYLSACALHGSIPEQSRLIGMDWNTLYTISKFHSMTAITAIGLEAAGVLRPGGQMPETLVQAWNEAMAKSIRKNLMLAAERQKLCAFMDKNGIWYMPLKGSILKDLYPRAGMRQMADNDILYDSHYQNTVKKYMVSQGYQAVSVGKGNHDVYEKPPIYNFELHTALFGAAHQEDWVSYYKNVKERLLPDRGADVTFGGEASCGEGVQSFGFHFSDEDFYIYMMTHAGKHHNGGGTGIRTLMDCYVYQWKKGSALDWNYITEECNKLGIAEFEQISRELCKKLFGDPERLPAGEQELSELLTETEIKFFYEFAGAGTYGTTQNRVQKKLRQLQNDEKPIREQTKWKYLIRRVIPDMEWFQSYVPFCYRHRIFIPFFIVFRLSRGVVMRFSNVKAEISAMKKS